MADFTPNYGLHQWEPTDPFLREDFNQDLSKIDEAIKGVEDNLQAQVNTKVGIVTGSYTGNGATSRTLTLGFQPVFLLIIPAEPGSAACENASLILIDTVARYQKDGNNPMVSPYYTGTSEMYTVTPTPTGIRMYSHPNWERPEYIMNESGIQYRYMAVKK